MVWLAAAVGLSSYAHGLAAVEKSDDLMFLPRDSPAAALAAFEDTQARADTSNAVVVYHRDGTLAPADRAGAEAVRQWATASGVPGMEAPTPLVVSKTGATAFFTIPIDRSVGRDAIKAAVSRVRERASSRDGLQVEVTGPAAVVLDRGDAFAGIDSTLLYASIAVVTVLLLLTYRSPVLWLLPLIAVGVGLRVAQSAVHLFGAHGGTVSDLAAGILTVLAFGAGTDYALLLIARYREELHHSADRHEALAAAMRRSYAAIVASAGTVIAGMLCMVTARLNTTRGLGPVAAIGIGTVLLVMLTLLPALLAVLGRWVFWPLTPRLGQEGHRTGPWWRIGMALRGSPRRNWMITTVLLLTASAGLLALRTDLNPLNAFRNPTGTVAGQRLLAQDFPGGLSAPTTVLVADSEAAAARRVIQATRGVAGVVASRPLGADRVELFVALDDDPYGRQARSTVTRLRSELVHNVDAGTLVGGATAIQVDTRTAAQRDDIVVGALVLVVIMLILGALLRSVVLPILLGLSVVLSFAAAFGLAALAFRYIFHFGGTSPDIPLYVYIFLVALGVDYNIFLMHRARQERLVSGARDGMARAVAMTGGVITSAGLVLAGTFTVLAVLPLVQLTEVGLAVALGILLDTFVVRTVLVPAVVLDLGEWAWWPSRPAY